MKRRPFLGAAAALAGLPGAVDADPDSIVEGWNELDHDYVDADCGSVPGSLTGVSVVGQMNDDPISVTGVREQDGFVGVALRWTSGPVEVGTGLDPDDARELAERLVVAADVADGEIEPE